MIEKLKNDKKFRSKLQLLAYGIFIVIVVVYSLMVNKDNINNMAKMYNNSVDTNTITTNNSDGGIILPDKYKYDFLIKINDIDYNYNGEYRDDILTINNKNGNYIYKDNNYYSGETLIEKDKIYGDVMDDYLSIFVINQLLSKSSYDGNNYRVYLRDIIIGNRSDKYIVINYNNNSNDINIEIDYTNLFNYFNDNINKYIVLMKFNIIAE